VLKEIRVHKAFRELLVTKVFKVSKVIKAFRELQVKDLQYIKHITV
jgi:hypothetical protein